jgi:HK97 family phage portal protein
MIGREVVSLIPLEPLRVQVEQLDTGKLRYRYTPANGMAELLPQEQVFHLRGLSLDGVTGIPLLRAMADALGIAIAADAATGRVMKNGNLSAGAVQVPGQMTDNAYQRLRDSLETVYAGAGNAGKWMILEEGSTAQRFSLSPEELQFLQLRDFQRYDIAAFMGVPPYLIGATEKSTSWGSGIEQQGIAFGTYTLLDHTKMWEEAIVRDLLSPAEAETYYFKFFLQSLVRADMKTRTAAYASGLQWGWLSPDAVRAMEDMNPREDGAGGRYYDPPNTASQPAPTGDPAADGNANEGNINDEPA